MLDPIDLSKLLKPLSDVGICLLDKIEHAGAYFLPSKDIKESKERACISIIDEIAKREDIHPIERMAIISNYKKIVKEYKNQTDILSIAFDNLKPDAKPDELEDDWLNEFFDKARNISDEEMKMVWGKILAEEVNSSGKISKQLLHMLSIMSKKDAVIFKKLAAFCFNIITTEGYMPAAVVFEGFNKANLGLSYFELARCERLGLVTMPSNGISIYTGFIKMSYGDHVFTLKCLETAKVKRVHMGTALLTDEASALLKILDREYSQSIYDYSMRAWSEEKTLEVIIER